MDALERGPLAPPERTLVDILGATAAAFPDEPAIDDGHAVVSYAELLTRVQEVARRLDAAGVGRGDRVGIRMPSGSADLYVAVLGTLAAGAAYVPVDADDPRERANLVFQTARVSAVLTGDLDLRRTGLSPNPPVSRGVVGPSVDDDAWIIFTSGSTGTPKGVAVTHRSAAAFVDAEARLFLQERPARTRRPGARWTVRGLRRLLRGDVAGLASWWVSGASAPRARAQRHGPGAVAGRPGDQCRLDRAHPRLALAARVAGCHPAVDLRRRGLPARAGRPAGRRGARGLEHLRSDRGHRRRLRRPSHPGGDGADRVAPRRLGSGCGRPRGSAGRPWRCRRTHHRWRRLGSLSRRNPEPATVCADGLPRLGAGLPQRRSRAGRSRRSGLPGPGRRPGQGRRPADRAR